MRRVPIRMKLAGALAVPLLALVVVTALEVVDSSRDAQRVREQVTLAEASIGPVSLLSHLENERNAAAVYLLGAEGAFALPVEDNAQAREATDAAMEAFRSEVEGRGGAIEAAYGPALDQMDTIGALRDEVDASPDGSRNLENIGAVSVNFDGYSAIMDPFFEANKRVALAVDDPELRRGAELVDLSARQTNLLAILVRDLLLAGIGGPADGVNTPQEIRAIASGVGQLRANERQIATKGTGIYADITDVLFADESVQRFPEVVDEAVATRQPNLDDVILHSAGDDPETFGYTVFRQGVTDSLSERGDQLVSAAEARQRWFVVLAVLALTVATMVTWLVSRSITKPLRSLTRQAKDMAERRLPEAVIDILETPLGDDVQVPSIPAVVVSTRDEVADVSDALNTVQDTALDLAVEQAVLRRNIADSFVNLGRRNQNLLGRQLDFITELESHEADADTLANLFRLDHLATRMRRNAESLLVLAGIEPPRQWAAPVRLTDVIRAALGEVEDYQRVTVRGVEPATILGSAAADLAHLMAELIENALVFSPPDQSVDIRGRNRDGGYTLAIIDSGLGMPPDDIVAANRRLAGAESFTIAPSKYLGHYVAGNLAARHDIHVHLENSPGNGVTATIDIPPTLLTTDTALAAPVTPPHGTRAIAAPAPEALQTVPAEPSWTSETPDWLLPGPAAVGQGARRPPAPPAAARRTESGLTKRNVRQIPAGPVPAEGPTGDLLDALSRHSARLHGGAPPSRPQPGPAPAPAPSPSPSRGWDAPGGSPASAPGRPAGRSWPLPPDPARPGPTRPEQRRPQPEPRGRPEPLPQPDPSSLPGPPQPFTPTWTPSPAPDGWEPPHATRSRSTAPGPAAAPPREQPGPAAAPPPGTGEVTTGGLTRRVRGAQLPTTEPVRMRRPGNQHGAGAAPAASTTPTPPPVRTPPARTPEQRRQADDVYTFLSSFTAGVRRGLEETTHDEPPASPAPHADPRWR